MATSPPKSTDLCFSPLIVNFLTGRQHSAKCPESTVFAPSTQRQLCFFRFVSRNDGFRALVGIIYNNQSERILSQISSKNGPNLVSKVTKQFEKVIKMSLGGILDGSWDLRGCPWGAKVGSEGALGGPRWVQHRILVDFGSISGSLFEGFSIKK